MNNVETRYFLHHNYRHSNAFSLRQIAVQEKRALCQDTREPIESNARQRHHLRAEPRLCHAQEITLCRQRAK